MESISLTELADEQLATARQTTARRASHTVHALQAREDSAMLLTVSVTR